MRNRLSPLRIGIVAASLSGLLLTAAVAGQPALANGTTIVNFASGKCVDIPGAASGDVQIQIWRCNANPQQGWTFINAGNGFSLIESTDPTGKCLSVKDNETTDGAAVIQHNCNFSGNDDFENWMAVNCDTQGHCRYKNEGNGRFLRPHDCGTADGTLLVMGNTCSSNGADFWS